MSKSEKTRINLLIDKLINEGFTRDDAKALRRISMTLRSWYTAECGTSNDYASWSIERIGDNQRPYRVTRYRKGECTTTPISDRENGAIKRLNAIMQSVPTLSYFLQTDPRGCALYILRPCDIPEGKKAESYYSNGIAVY